MGLTSQLILFLAFVLLITPGLPSVVAKENILFQKTWGGPGEDVAIGVKSDTLGNIYLTGYTYSFGPGSPTTPAVVLLKYSLSGALQWQRIWSANGAYMEVGRRVAVDSVGNVYLTGYNGSFAGGPAAVGFNVILLKFNSTGSLLWQRTWKGGRLDFGEDIAVDSFGNVYLAGSGNGGLLLLKFNSTGNLAWQRIWVGGDVAYGVALDSSDNIYVTGSSNCCVSPSNLSVVLLKFDPSGGLFWQKYWGSNTVAAGGYDVAVDPSSNIYITGYIKGFGAGGNDVLLLKFDGSGNLKWARTWGGSNWDEGYGVTADSAGNAYVAGHTSSFGAGMVDALLLKFNSTGNLLVQRTLGGANDDGGLSVTVNPSDNAIVAGSVSEAPPYTLGGNGNTTLGIPSFPASTPSASLATPDIAAGTPSGQVTTPSGSEAYAGNSDVILFKYGLPPMTPALPSFPLTVLLSFITAVLVRLIAGRRRFGVV